MDTTQATVDELREYIEIRGKCTKPVKPSTRRRRDPWHEEPPRGRYSRDAQRQHAQRACRGCPVQRECLEVALALEERTGQPQGYWGATIPSDRYNMLIATGRLPVACDTDGLDVAS